MTYPSDLTETQWKRIRGHFDTGNYGKSRKHSQRKLVNAVFLSHQKQGVNGVFYLRSIPLENSL